MATKFDWSDRQPGVSETDRRAIADRRAEAVMKLFPGNDLVSTRSAAVALAEDELLAAQERGNARWIAFATEQLEEARAELAQAKRSAAQVRR
jgi:hypothetical protein